MIQDLVQEEKSPKKSSSKQVSVLYNLTAEEQVQQMKKAQEIAAQWFLKICKKIQDKDCWMIAVDDITSRKWLFDSERERFFYEQFQLRRSPYPVSFTTANYSAFGVKQGERVTAPTTLNRAAFVLLQTCERQAKDYIFYGKPLLMDNLPKILRKWGYVPVTIPAANDLVLYLDAEERPTHLGRYLKSGQVESKLGSKQPYFHWHNIFDVPLNYGDRVVFWRKKK